MLNRVKKIVIIEDDTDAQEVYQTVLSEHHFQPFFATSGQLGLQLIKSEKPHLIILDLMLPGILTGMDVLGAIRKYPALVPIPVLVVTNLLSEKTRAIEAGATDFVGKMTTSLDELVKIIEKYAI